MTMSKKSSTMSHSVSSIGTDKDYNSIKQMHLNAKQSGKRLPHKVAVLERDTGRVKMFFDSWDARKYRDEVGGVIYYPGSGPEVAYLRSDTQEKKILKYDKTYRYEPNIDLYQAQNKYKWDAPSPVKFDFHDMYDNIMVPRPPLLHGASQCKTMHKGTFPINR